ncbi:site-2 protease family protein [Salinibaculum rarum]|uniref:site-2 protease family protein n=1 Tax=Salinibaculum rarum TaxID=3058903 RepID=UPI00266029DA|nr:site-2 protease family protein [Salinibaculum sp. KK48]
MQNYTLGAIWGIPIRVNVSLLVFLPILAYLIGSGEQITVYASLIDGLAPAGLDAADLAGQRWTVGILAAVGLFVSVGIHELGHSWAAMRYGIQTESITLWILGGLASFTEMPREWNREFWIAIAGPITSVLVAGVCLAALTVIPAGAPVVVFVVGWLAVTNVVLAVFNLLPAFPMDGGRVLRALLSRWLSYTRATQVAARIGTIFAVLFAVVGVLAFSPILLLLAFFIYGAATSESKMVVVSELLADLTVGDLLTEVDPVGADSTLADLFPKLIAARRTDLPVVDASGTAIGVVTAKAMQSVATADYETTRVDDLVNTDLPRLDAEMDAFDALVALGQNADDVALVERRGTVVGVVSRSDFAAALDLRRGKQPF